MAFATTLEFCATVEDVEGERSWTSVFYVTDGNDTLLSIENRLDVWNTALESIINGKVVKLSVTADKFRDQGHGNGVAYAHAEDKAVLVFRATSTGLTFTQKIPTPKANVFLSDGETVNPASTSMADYIQLVQTFHVPKGGGSFSPPELQYTRGYRLRSRTRRTMRQGVAAEQGG